MLETLFMGFKKYGDPFTQAVKNFREKAKQVLNRKNLAISEEEAVRRLNYLITGWTNYFNHSNASRIYNILQKFIDWLFYKFIAHRHKKRGKEQIVIGLVMADGIPIYHEVWKGNTVDPKTLESTISALKERFNIKNVVFIADRAFGRSKSLNLLDQNQYITAAYRWDKPYRYIPPLFC